MKIEKLDMPHIVAAELAIALLIIYAIIGGLIGSASGQQQFTAKLLGKNGTAAKGIAILTLSPDGTSIHYVLNVTDITGVTGAHIHAGTTTQNGPVVAGLFNLGASSTGKIYGVLSKGNIRSLDLAGPLAGKELSDLVLLIKTGNTYVDIHTRQNPKGEIRGQLS